MKGLKKYFPAWKRTFLEGLTRRDMLFVKAVDGVDLRIGQGEIVALVGESGSGKTTLGRLLVTLETPTEGEIYFEGQKIEGRDKIQKLRRGVQMVFQNPLDSLDPRMAIEDIVTEPLFGARMEKKARQDAFIRALTLVGLDATTFALRRPRDLSGGQRQRIAVARAIISSPKFIVLDEPTSALDVSVQGQVLNLLADLQEQLEFAYLLITHNISVARYISNRIAVMYAGKVVELGPTREVLRSPRHPYTQALLKAVPNLETKELTPPAGEVPSLIDLPKGCRFNPRCPYVMDVCRTTEPGLLREGEVEVACWLYR